MNRFLVFLLILSTLFVTVAFLGGEPSSTRGFYYVAWLLFARWLWQKQDRLREICGTSTSRAMVRFIGLGILMILIEETMAGIAVNVLHVASLGELLAIVPQYYANNLFLLPGFIVAWYILARRYAYTNREIFVLVGLFGLFSEKIYLHILTIPILGIPLILPTMFTYMGIIAPSVATLSVRGTRELVRPLRYLIGLLFPIVVSIPFVFVHTLLSKVGIIDPTVLMR